MLDLRSSGIFRGVMWYSFTDVSGQRIGPSGLLTLEDGTDKLTRNVGK